MSEFYRPMGISDDYIYWHDYDPDADSSGPGDPNEKPLITKEQLDALGERAKRHAHEVMALMQARKRDEISLEDYRVAYREMTKRHEAENQAAWAQSSGE